MSHNKTLFQYDTTSQLVIKDFHLNMAEEFQEFMFLGLARNKEVCKRLMSVG